MNLYELDTGWVETAGDLRFLHWELLACDEIRGVFATDRKHVLAVLFDGSLAHFRLWARDLADSAESKGVLQ